MQSRYGIGKFLTSAAIAALVAFPGSASAANVTQYLEYQALEWNGQVIAVEPLAEFYSSRDGNGLWTDRAGLNENGTRLLKAIRNADNDGLDPSDYLSAFPDNVTGISAEALPGVELYFSQAFLAYARDLHAGRTTPAVSEPDIVIPRKPVDPSTWLQKVARDGLDAAISSLRPSHPQYAQLRQMLNGYRNLARLGGWSPIPEGPTLKPGMTDTRVSALRKNLKGRGYQGINSQVPDTFDEGLADVVRHF
ncbi:MAG: hypothetical protein AAFN43_02820 [Pseudomonadota bacterium]